MRNVRWSWVVAVAASITVILTGSHFTAGTQLVADRTSSGLPWVVRLAAVPQGHVHGAVLDAARAVGRHPSPARHAPHATLARSASTSPAGSSGATPSAVRAPSWWSGVCNVNNHPGSFPLSSWNGLTACGPGPNRGGYDAALTFFPGAWGQYEWECVELSMRWMYLAYGVHPYPANGGQVVSNYSRADGGNLHAVENDGKSVPVPGDVLSMGTPWEEGHTAVVTAVHVSHGYGTVSVLEQNVDSGNGTNTIAVVGGVLEPEYGFPITGWLAVPPPVRHHVVPLTINLTAARIASMRWAALATALGAHKPGKSIPWLHPSGSVVLEEVLGVGGH